MSERIDYILRVQKILEWKEKYCKDFNPKKSFPTTKTCKVITSYKGLQTIVGRAYLIAEKMSEEKAPKKEMERAVRYLMVCIDAEKHKLNYKKAFEDFGIRELSSKYHLGYY